MNQKRKSIRSLFTLAALAALLVTAMVAVGSGATARPSCRLYKSLQDGVV